MSDIFSEVDEDLRREQFRKIWERYGNLILAVAVLIVVGVGGWRGWQWYEGKLAGEAGARFEAAVTLGEQKKFTEAEAAFNQIAAEGPKGYKLLARLRAPRMLRRRVIAANPPRRLRPSRRIIRWSRPTAISLPFAPPISSPTRRPMTTC